MKKSVSILIAVNILILNIFTVMIQANAKEATEELCGLVESEDSNYEESLWEKSLDELLEHGLVNPGDYGIVTDEKTEVFLYLPILTQVM